MNPLMIGAIANLAGGVLGGGQDSSASDAANANKQMYQNIPLPDVEKMKLLLQQYASAGQLTPEQMQAMTLSGQDQLEDVALDPRLKQAQMDALSFMQKTGQGDLTPAERSEVNNLRRKTEADSQSRLQAMLQQQDARGVGSSDMALAARMLDAQGSANRQAESADNISAAAFQRALQSMSSGANLAGSMESADYGRQAQLAEAQRNRELTNFSNQQNISNQNVGNRNAAQQFNLQNAQSLSNQNTDLMNQQQQYNKQLEQQNFNNQLARATGVANANTQYGSTKSKEEAGERAGIGSIARGIGGVAANFIKAPDNKPTIQTGQPNTSDFDALIKKQRTV